MAIGEDSGLECHGATKAVRKARSPPSLLSGLQTLKFPSLWPGLWFDPENIQAKLFYTHWHIYDLSSMGF